MFKKYNILEVGGVSQVSPDAQPGHRFVSFVSAGEARRGEAACGRGAKFVLRLGCGNSLRAPAFQFRVPFPRATPLFFGCCHK